MKKKFVSLTICGDDGTASIPQTYNLVLQAVGFTASVKKIAADKARMPLFEGSFIKVDIRMRRNLLHVVAIGDNVTRVIPSVAPTDPEMA